MSINLYRDGGSWPHQLEAELFQFPAGEWSIRTIGDIPAETPIFVDVRGCDSNDIMAAGVACRWAKRRGHDVSLLLPYLPAARSDHDEVMGVSTYADMVATFGADRIVTLDPHSPAALAAYGSQVKVVDHTPYVVAAAQRMCKSGEPLTGIIAADKSGSTHAARAADELGVPMFQALKVRDPETGQLSRFECESLPDTGQLLVVDDICDGGGTFMGLASVAGVPRERLGLWVTHGLFTGKALDILPAAYGYIASTNSVGSVPAGIDDFDITTALYTLARKA